MASISSSSAINYHTSYLANLCMPSADESSLSWIAKEEIRSRIRYKNFEFEFFFPSLEERVIFPRISELTLMGLQKFWKDPYLDITPSRILVGVPPPSTSCLFEENILSIFDKFDPHFHTLCFRMNSPLEQIVIEALKLNFETVRKTIQLADELLISLLKKEEIAINGQKFADITRELESFMIEAETRRLSDMDLMNATETKKEAHLKVIDTLKFLFHSLTFFQINLGLAGPNLTAEQLRDRMIVETLVPLPIDITSIIIEYGSLKTINSKKHIINNSATASSSS